MEREKNVKRKASKGLALLTATAVAAVTVLGTGTPAAQPSPTFQPVKTIGIADGSPTLKKIIIFFAPPYKNQKNLHTLLDKL